MKTSAPPAILSAPPLPLLVTGIAGVAGYNAFQYFQRLYPGQVVGTRRADNWRLAGDGIVGCDADDARAMAELFERYRFRSVLSCEGTCKLKSCELNPHLAWRVNVLGAQGLLELIGSQEIRLIHLSIDLVFSGTAGGKHVESDPTDPVTIYGKTMVQTERLVQQYQPDACILRISLPMGISFNGHAGAIDWIQSRFCKQRPATLYYDEIRTPTYTDCLNRLLHFLLRSRSSGLYHAGGPRALSLYQIAQIVNRVGGYRPEDLQGCHRIEAGPMPPRAGDVSMDSSALVSEIGFAPFDPWPLDERWIPSHPQWHHERDDEPGSPELLRQVLYRNGRRN